MPSKPDCREPQIGTSSAAGELPDWQGPFQILALDGGGIRGLFSAAVLAKLEEDVGVSIRNHFDLVVGTSTGGIIALGLGLGLSPREIVEFYVKQGSKVFRDSWARRARRIFRHKYEQRPLADALREVLGDKRIGNSTKRLVIPAYNLGRDDVRLFKTPHHPRLTRDWRIPAWQVALATSAAPTYFPACRKIGETRLIDGGVWANNPTMIGVVEAKSMLGVPLDAIRVLSLGTCEDIVYVPDRLDIGGCLSWSRSAVRVAMRGQSLGTHNLAVHLLGKDRVFRLDPVVPESLYALDRVTADKIIAEATHASLHFNPDFAREFAVHDAPPYEPCQPVQENVENRR